MVESDTEFVESVPRTPQPSAFASTSRLTDASIPADSGQNVGPTNDGNSSAVLVPASSDQPHAQGDPIDPIANEEPQAGNDTPPATATSKPKIFLKSTSPDLPLHILLQDDLPHAVRRKLQIAIRAHGGVLDSRLAYSDFALVDPSLFASAKRLLRRASEIGQPIPVVSLDYIHDCVAHGQKLDPEDPKYKFDGTRKPANAAITTNGASTGRYLHGRNRFTESDRQAIVSYFIDKPEASWSLNACAKELAERLSTHSYTSFQSHLQENFEKGWNLKQKVLLARRAALEGEPSELQARVLRSQYSASPALVEQPAPSDGWPRVSPSLSSHESRSPPPDQARKRATTPSRDDLDDEDLEVRQPNPGTAPENVEKSPTKVHLPVVYASSEPSEAPSSSDSSLLRQSTNPKASGSGPNPVASPSVDEESDPEEYSAQILNQISKAPSRSRPSGNTQHRSQTQEQRRSSDSESDDDEVDELDLSSARQLEEAETSDEITESRKLEQAESEDSEWEGTRLARRKMRERGASGVHGTRVKFVAEEKEELVKQLANYVVEHGRAPDGLTQDVVLAKPADDFWERFAAANPSHSTMSWKSHYLKNRASYKQLIEIEIEERNSDGEEMEKADGADQEDLRNGQESASVQTTETQSRRGFSIGNILDRFVSSWQQSPIAKKRAEQPPSEPTRAQRSEEMSMPADGIVVMLPARTDEDPIPGTPRKRSDRSETELSSKKPAPKQAAPEILEQWPEAPSPPLMDDEDGGMMQVETDVDAASEASAEELQSGSLNVPPPDGGDSPMMEQDVESDEPERNRDEDAASSDRESVATKGTTAEATKRPQRHHRIEAGLPVLARHRDAAFYDFTMDSDEESRIQKARSRPSLPNLGPQRRRSASRSAIASNRVVSHVATPARNHTQRPELQVKSSRSPLEEERAQRTREWARSVSRTPSSASPDSAPDIPPTAVKQPSRARAQRIDRTPRVHTGIDPSLSPRLQQQPSRRASGGRSSTGIPATSPALARGEQGQTRSSKQRQLSRKSEEAARAQYRADVERFRSDYALDKEQLRSLLMRFKASVKDARRYIERWLRDMEGSYGVEAHLAFEYVKTAQGDFEQAETFLRLATVTRSRSAPDLLGKRTSRSASYSEIPAKRRQLADDSSFVRQGSSRRNSSNRHRR